MIIRAARIDDLPAIEAVHVAAFSVSRLGHNGEATLVRALHESGDALVSLVAERQRDIIGHVMFSAMRVEADGTALIGAGLAPVSVLPEAQATGVASALIRAGIDALIIAGVQISFVLGATEFYRRFGYSAGAAAPFASPYAGAHFMALWLDKSVQTPKSGSAYYARAFG